MPQLAELSPIPEKLSFKIGETSDLVGVKPHVLRFWEREFSRVRPSKSRNGHRLYSRADVELLRKIRRLLHERGFTISGARSVLREGSQAVDVALAARPAEATAALDEAKSRTMTLEAELEAVRRQARAASRVAQRAKEEAAFWRNEAQQAEARLGALITALRAELEALQALPPVSAGHHQSPEA